MELYIVNSFDKPCEKLIARKEGDTLEYIHPEMKNWGKMSYLPVDARKLEDFGLEIEIENLSSGEKILRGKKTRESVCPYSDGKIRNWQGSSSFSFCF